MNRGIVLVGPMTMGVRFVCPGCGSAVLIPGTQGSLIANDVSLNVGCDNTEEHDDGEPLVMWPDDEY